MREDHLPLRRGGAETRERGRPRLLQPVSCARPQRLGALIEVMDDFPREFGFSFAHRVIPFAFSIPAKAWTAREQWVFTLPSEQPIAAAVSATSSSSQ